LKGIALAVIDGFVAATAKHHELAVVTRNVKDFTVWGALVINPWEG
jgi:toxin FitB